jgi:hypothetical protein
MKLPTMQVPVPTIEDVGLDQYVINGKPFAELLNIRTLLKQSIEDSEAAIHDIDAEVGAALDLKGVKNVIWNDHLVTRREGAKPRQTLDRTLLLNAGVTPLQLAAGTKLGKPGKSGVTVMDLSKVRSRQENGSNESGEGSEDFV